MRINDKIGEIELYLEELEAFMPDKFSVYSKDPKTRAACERYFERIIEAAVELAFLVIKDNGLKMPEDEKETFDILAKELVIPKMLAEKLKDAKGMRNILAHQYGNVDDRIVFRSITKELVKDIKDFLRSIRKSGKL